MDQNNENYGQPYPGNDQNQTQQQYNNNYTWNGGNGNAAQPYQTQPMKAEVHDVFCNLLLAIFVLQMVVSMVMVHGMFKAMDYDSLMNGTYTTQMYSGSYIVCSVLSLLMFLGMVIFFVLDIVGINKGGYKITGLILFAILLRPGYYIWRAYVLGRKKTFPIIYTVLYCVLFVGYICFVMAEVMHMFATVAGV